MTLRGLVAGLICALSIAFVGCASEESSDAGTPAGRPGGGSAMAGGAEGMAGLAPDSGSGASGRGVPPSNGPRPCGCAADQICVAWQVPSGIPSGMTPDCWIAPAECLSDSYVRGIEALCGCFNPCGAWLGGDGLACYDRRTNPGLLRGPEDLRCILRGP